MINKQRILAQAQSIIAQRKTSAEEDLRQRLQQLDSDTSLRVCNAKLRQAQVLYGTSCGDAQQQALQRIEQLKTQKSVILSGLGVKEQDLVARYSCPTCNDTGYVKGAMCSCLKREFCKLLYVNSGLHNQNYTFGKALATTAHNQAVFRKAKQVCHDGKQNVLLTGKTGTGKTFLLNACANYCITQCKQVIYTTAYNLNNLFLQAHLGDYNEKQSICDQLCQAEVLVVDDLGTENVYRNVTAEYLFVVLNERLSNNRVTYVSTNLDLRGLMDRYDARIVSRLLDKDNTFIAQLDGADQRLK